MNKVVVVTGGGRGIGAAIALEAAREGYAVVVNYRANTARAEAVAEQIRAGGGDAFAWRADVADPAAVAGLFDEVDRRYGRLDALVNNAGTNGKVVPFTEIDRDSFVEVYLTNVFGFFHCAQQAARRLSTAKGGNGGVIINISSAAARTGGMPGHVHYASSKGAVDVFGYALARELAPQGIRVVTVRPGIIDTEIQQVFAGTGLIERALTMVPLGRLGQPEEVARTVLWLMSPGASYITATTIDVTGGR
jgi:NAD(P)-dependent dehydrogenase (short-subunit alcohol dehydrogenase family)